MVISDRELVSFSFALRSAHFDTLLYFLGFNFTMSRHKGLNISLRELRIAKIERRTRMTPCGMEFENYLSALARVSGNAEAVPDGIAKALNECMGKSRLSQKQKEASVQFHLAKFVKRN